VMSAHAGVVPSTTSAAVKRVRRCLVFMRSA
jgi:hypothetical protein